VVCELEVFNYCIIYLEIYLEELRFGDVAGARVVPLRRDKMV